MKGAWQSTTIPAERYLYNGKELERGLGLEWSFYGARMCDFAIGRFTGVDPKADQFAWVSPYNYAENMVPRVIDLWGLQQYDPNTSLPPTTGPDTGEKKGPVGMESSSPSSSSASSNPFLPSMDTPEESTESTENTESSAESTENVKLPNLPAPLSPASALAFSITQQPRHLIAPDAIAFTLTQDASSFVNVGTEEGFLWILQGVDAGIYPLVDVGSGVGLVDASATGEATLLYYSGDYSDLVKENFFGNRFELNLSAGEGLQAGLTGVYAPNADAKGGFVFGWGASIGLGGSATFFSLNFNWGASGRSGDELDKYLPHR